MPYKNENEDNPYAPEIDGYWQDLQPALARYDGHAASDILHRAYQENQRIWNALYWRTDKWLAAWFVARDPRATRPDMPGLTFGDECLAGFVADLFPERLTPIIWKGTDLPQLLPSLRELGVQLRAQRTGSNLQEGSL